MTLDECRSGDQVKLLSITGSGPLVHRLMELGLLAGRQLTLIRRAPLGDPIQIRVGATLLAIRSSDAQRIQVAT